MLRHGLLTMASSLRGGGLQTHQSQVNCQANGIVFDMHCVQWNMMQHSTGATVKMQLLSHTAQISLFPKCFPILQLQVTAVQRLNIAHALCIVSPLETVWFM